MKLKCLALAIVILLTSVVCIVPAFADDAKNPLTLLPPPDSQRYAPLTAKTTRVYVVETRNVYMACKVEIPIEEIDKGYIFINQTLAFNSKFEENNLAKGIEVSKESIVNGYIVFNMQDYKNVTENKAPNRVVVGVKKTDGKILFSETVLLTIATGEMSCESVVTGEMVTYHIKQGFLPLDPSTITVTANGNPIPYKYNNYKKSVSVLVAPSDDGNPVQDIKFSVKDLKGKAVTVDNQIVLSDHMNTLRSNFTRLGLAKYVFALSGYETAVKPFIFSDIDFIPYEDRLVASSLAENGLMLEGTKFNPDEQVTQKVLADVIRGLTKRQLYTPTDDNAPVTVDQAIEQLLSITAL